MSIKNTGEPSLEKMDDYNGKESPSKRKTINTIIIVLLVMGAGLAYLKYNNPLPSDYIETQDKPGINTSKGMTH